MNIELGTLSKIDLRATFSGDKAPLTNWLSTHLDQIGAALGMQLELISQGSGGSYGEIVARDLGRGRTVIIENALESSDDSRLGKLITCASDRDAGAVVWVGPEFRTSHRQALEWLNRRGAAEFYAIGLELFRIGDSKPAARFRLLAGPGGVAEAAAIALVGERRTQIVPERAALKPIVPEPPEVKPAAAAVEQTGRPGVPTSAPQLDNREAYRAFFQRLMDELREKHRFTTARTAQPQNWYTFASGVSGVVYSVWFSTANRLKVELYIDVGSRELNHTVFDQLRFRVAEIEKEFGDKLEWESIEGRRACSIGIQANGKIDDPPEALDKILKWSVDRLVRFKTVFGPRLLGFERALAQQMKKN